MGEKSSLKYQFLKNCRWNPMRMYGEFFFHARYRDMKFFSDDMKNLFKLSYRRRRIR